ncbi:MAG: LysR family transcriptional regulator [Chloroflexi bacterium]|nr:LysR family transcriptional regulator [Chloroflexota bacterium]
MSDERASGTRDGLRVRSKVWVERDGTVIISEYRARLLAAIARTGSVAGAAEALGLPYRTAWKKLREMEAAAGVGLVESDSGGAAGGASRLTAAAHELLAAFERVSEPVAGEVAARFREERAHFGA